MYHSPHKFSHGHAVYALTMAKDVAALKAVSQNLMHENLAVTDGVYGILSERDVGAQIRGLRAGVRAAGVQARSNLIAMLEQVLSELRGSSTSEDLAG